MGWRQVVQSRATVWAARACFIPGRKVLGMPQPLAWTCEYPLIRILFNYIINPTGIINLDSTFHLSLVLLMFVDTLLSKYFIMSGGRRRECREGKC